MGYYLINNRYGGFGWSEEAEKEINRRKELQRKYALIRAIVAGDTVWPGDDVSDYYHRRCPIALALFDEWGSKRCSDDHSELRKTEVVDELMDHVKVKEYDGLESIYTDTRELYQKMMEDVLSNETKGCTIEDVMACRKEFLRIMACHEELRRKKELAFERQLEQELREQRENEQEWSENEQE